MTHRWLSESLPGMRLGPLPLRLGSDVARMFRKTVSAGKRLLWYSCAQSKPINSTFYRKRSATHPPTTVLHISARWGGERGWGRGVFIMSCQSYPNDFGEILLCNSLNIDDAVCCLFHSTAYTYKHIHCVTNTWFADLPVTMLQKQTYMSLFFLHGQHYFRHEYTVESALFLDCSDWWGLSHIFEG